MGGADQEGRDLREAVAALGLTKQSRRFDAKLERRIVTYCRRRMADGATQAELCRLLDVSSKTLTHFLRRSPETALVPVMIKSPAQSGARLAVHGPCGVDVHGDVDAIAALIARLSCSA